MAKAKQRVTTPRRTASKRLEKKASKRRQGLAFIDASSLRKAAREPDLKRELKAFRHSNDIENLAALYDAYKAGADAIQAIINQPRAEGIDGLLDAEWKASSGGEPAPASGGLGGMAGAAPPARRRASAGTISSRG